MGTAPFDSLRMRNYFEPPEKVLPRGPPLLLKTYEISKSSKFPKDFKISGKISRDFKISRKISREEGGVQSMRK